MKKQLYDFKLLNNDGGIISYVDKSRGEMNEIINKHLQDKFNCNDVKISYETIYNMMKGRNKCTLLKIFVKQVIKKDIVKGEL